MDVDPHELAEEYRRGMSIRQLSEQHGLHTETVRRLLREAEVQMRPPGAWQTPKPKTKLSRDEIREYRDRLATAGPTRRRRRG